MKECLSQLFLSHVVQSMFLPHRYTCIMSNTLGTERGISSLSVISLTPGEDEVRGGLDDDSTTTGIIIIAVSINYCASITLLQMINILIMV